MIRNAFGEPRPASFDEIAEAMDEVFGFSEDVNCQLAAQVFDSTDEDKPYNGFTAVIADAETGEPTIQTCGFPDKEALIEGLGALGIQLIEDFA
jgi:hypothetical protein